MITLGLHRFHFDDLELLKLCPDLCRDERGRDGRDSSLSGILLTTNWT
ncbi:MAG: hypothetical protein ACI8T1_002969 [Verrucomicrobiales bacterium]|jgi:hypothetical protein